MSGSSSIFSVLEESGRRWPDHPAIIDAFGSIDYGTLLTATEKAALHLADAGLRPGDGVAVQARNGRAFVMAAFAAVKCGATVLPAAHTLTQAERDEMLARTPVHMLISEQQCEGEFPGAPRKLLLQDRLPMYVYATSCSRGTRVVDFVPEAAFMRYTSGTTGTAKGVVLSHQGIRERILAANRGLGLRELDRVLFVLPMAYHFYVSILLYLHAGATIVLGEDHSAAAMAEKIRQHQVTFLYASPLHYMMLANDPSLADKLATLRLAVSTSTGLDRETAEKFFRTFGRKITQAYGIIEIGLPMINLQDAGDKPQAVGRPLPDYEAAILDDDGQIMPNGLAGNLAVRGPGMFSAYLDPFLKSEDVLRNGWFMTGDIAARDEQGCTTVLGRKKSMINVCGEKVFPEEVEEVLKGHPQVAEANVYGVAHPRMGEVVHARVVVDNARVDSEALIRFARDKLSPFKVPQQIHYVEHIEKTSSGKVSRRNF